MNTKKSSFHTDSFVCVRMFSSCVIEYDLVCTARTFDSPTGCVAKQISCEAKWMPRLNHQSLRSVGEKLETPQKMASATREISCKTIEPKTLIILKHEYFYFFSALNESINKPQGVYKQNAVIFS